MTYIIFMVMGIVLGSSLGCAVCNNKNADRILKIVMWVGIVISVILTVVNWDSIGV